MHDKKIGDHINKRLSFDKISAINTIEKISMQLLLNYLIQNKIYSERKISELIYKFLNYKFNYFNL